MDYIRTTPHCGRWCFRTKDGAESHHHAQAQRWNRRWRGQRGCGCDMCRPPVSRSRKKAEWRREEW